MSPKIGAKFIEPMLLLRTDKLQDDLSHWMYEIKLDGLKL
jgi:ATP-dependent DNA ligase